MSYERYRQDRGYVDPKTLPTGANGRALCRYCSQEVPAKRKSFCSEACVHEFKVQSQPAYARKCVFERDRGICKKCGLDTEELKQTLYQLRQRDLESYNKLLHKLMYTYGADFRLGNHFFEIDHIQAVKLGGGSCGLDNLMTLCIPCHRQKTRLDMQKIRGHQR